MEHRAVAPRLACGSEPWPQLSVSRDRRQGLLRGSERTKEVENGACSRHTHEIQGCYGVKGAQGGRSGCMTSDDGHVRHNSTAVCTRHRDFRAVPPHAPWSPVTALSVPDRSGGRTQPSRCPRAVRLQGACRGGGGRTKQSILPHPFLENTLEEERQAVGFTPLFLAF